MKEFLSWCFFLSAMGSLGNMVFEALFSHPSTEEIITSTLTGSFLLFCGLYFELKIINQKLQEKSFNRK